MNMERSTSIALAQHVVGGCTGAGHAEIVIFPPLVYIDCVSSVVRDTPVELGAQDLSSEVNGALTGEVSAEMLTDLGVQWVLVGHSERRQRIGESDDLVADKLLMALESGLKVFLCVGETLEQRKSGEAQHVVARQLTSALASVPALHLPRMVIAYEPIWAIGTGVVATPADARSAHEGIRKVLADRYDPQLASETRVVYGGSLAPGNSKAIFEQPGVDGGLVGGASLKAPDFLAICSSVKIGIGAG